MLFGVEKKAAPRNTQEIDCAALTVKDIEERAFNFSIYRVLSWI